MTSPRTPPLQLIIGLFLLTLLPLAECHDGTSLFSVGGVLVMIIFTCCLCMCYRRMYEHRIAMAEAAHAPRAVIIATCQSRRTPGASSNVASPATCTGGGILLPYTPSPHFNPYSPRSADDIPYGFRITDDTRYGRFDSPTGVGMPQQPSAGFNTQHAPVHEQSQPPPPSYESLFPSQTAQINTGNQPHPSEGTELRK